MVDRKKTATADLESLHRVFTISEAPTSTLHKIEQQISEDLTQFLQKHIASEERDLTEIEKDFLASSIPEEPIFVSEQADFLLEKVVSQSVHTASPSFIGHMTSALPHFMLSLSKIMIALNQNLVKIETSKVFTPIERQVLGMLHHLIFKQEASFYQRWMHDRYQALGAFCSGGSIANITALWVARNKAFAPTQDFLGISQEGLHRALQYYGHSDLVILVSERGHYSLSKAADVLGLGRKNLIAIAADENNKIDLKELEKKCQDYKKQGIKVLAIVGVAGASETGSVDPLNQMADIAQAHNIYFHVDAAWGGPTLCSARYAAILKGIERADSVTLDAHKQLYVPMGVGMVLFKDPTALNSIEHHAEYVIRKGSKDLGSHSLEGSRPGMALLVHSGLHVIGRKGYELLIDLGIEKAKRFARMIESHPDFELISAPELNILTYRYVPQVIQLKLMKLDAAAQVPINQALNELTRLLQKMQRAHGKSFVSRTQLNPLRYYRVPIVVFRVVLANPLTTDKILAEVLAHQVELAHQEALLIHQLEKINGLL